LEEIGGLLPPENSAPMPIYEMGSKLKPTAGLRNQRFDENELRELRADGQSGVANLADEIRLAGNEPDDPVFAQADFAKAILHFRPGAKLFDANGDTGLDAAQGADLAAGFLPLHHGVNLADIHAISFPIMALGYYPSFAIC